VRGAAPVVSRSVGHLARSRSWRPACRRACRGVGRLARSRSWRLACRRACRGVGRLARSRSRRPACRGVRVACRGVCRLARHRTRRPLPRLVQLPEPRPTSGGPAASVSLRHGRHLRAEGPSSTEGSRLPYYPPRHHAPEGPGFCGQLLTQLPVCSLSGCSGSCTRWGYLDSGPTCRPVRVFPGGHARECFPSLLDARSTARTLPLRGHRCPPSQAPSVPSTHPLVSRSLRTDAAGAPPPEPSPPAAPPPPIPRAKPRKWRNPPQCGGRHLPAGAVPPRADGTPSNSSGGCAGVPRAVDKSAVRASSHARLWRTPALGRKSPSWSCRQVVPQSSASATQPAVAGRFPGSRTLSLAP
jgi:hypothetical protein